MELGSLFERLQDFSFGNYCATPAVDYAFACSLLIATICYILAKLTNQYSWVDRIWPLLPIGYGAHYLYHQQSCRQTPIATRQILMLILTIAWGIKHTFNFARKGGFKKGGQDYRWAHIRKTYHWIARELLSFFFIAYYQIILIQWFSSPLYAASEQALNAVDIALTVLWVGLLLTEITADNQQWNFQKRKYELLAEHDNQLEKLPARYRLGFCADGLFKYCRHPNFFCEISIWWLMFFFSVNSAGCNWTGLGALMLNLLFLGSTDLTEKISASKYPKYAQYQKTTPRLYPLFVSSSFQAKKEE